MFCIGSSTAWWVTEQVPFFIRVWSGMDFSCYFDDLLYWLWSCFKFKRAVWVRSKGCLETRGQQYDQIIKLQLSDVAWKRESKTVLRRAVFSVVTKMCLQDYGRKETVILFSL